jgi:hypothetical protein
MVSDSLVVQGCKPLEGPTLVNISQYLLCVSSLVTQVDELALQCGAGLQANTERYLLGSLEELAADCSVMAGEQLHPSTMLPMKQTVHSP